VLLRAIPAQTEHFHVETLDSKARGRTLLQSDWLNVGCRHIHDRFASKANQMVVRRGIGFKARGSMVRTHLVNEPVLLEGLQVFVYSSK
jgi:hypothetical protein